MALTKREIQTDPCAIILDQMQRVPDLPVYFDQSIRYTDFLTIVLTALAVLLAVLGLGIGLLAFVGYRQIINAAKKSAVEAVNREIKSYFEGQEFRDVLQVVTGKAVPVDDEPKPTPEKKIGEEYPKEGSV